MNIPKCEDLSVNSVNSEDPIENLVIKYKHHPSIRAIFDKSPNTPFSLKIVSKKRYRKGNIKPKCSKSISRHRYNYKNNKEKLRYFL